MAKKDKHTDDMMRDMEKYRNNDLSDKDRHTYERNLQRDPFLGDANEGFSNLTDDEIATDMKSLGNRLGKRVGRRTLIFYRAAAAIVILVGISSILLVKELKRPDMMAENSGPFSDSLNIVTNEVASEIVDDVKENRIEPDKGIQEDEAFKMDVTDTDQALGTEEIPEMKNEKIDPLAALVVDTPVNTESKPAEVSDLILDKKLVKIEEVGQIDEVKKDIARSRKVGAVKAEEAVPSISQAREKGNNIAINTSMISGRIIAEDDNLPLPGATIVIKGTSKGVTTDLDGNFTIRADTDDILVASYLGMESRELKPGEGFISDIVLTNDNLALEEVVVVAYGTNRKSDNYETGAVTEVDPDYEATNYERSFPVGGMTDFRSYVKMNQHFPADWTKSDREVVRVKFDVGINGALQNIEVIHSPDRAFSDEAIRLIKEGPAWSPATKEGEKIEESVRLRIVFRK